MSIVETDRLIISEADLSDAHFFVKLMNSHGWLRYIGDRKIKTKEDASNYIQQSLIANYKAYQHGLYLLKIRDKQQPIGICGLLQRDYLPAPDIGFAILPEFEGQGYVTEAGIAVIEDAKLRLGIQKVMGITLPENKGSQRVLEKLGLSYQNQINRDGEVLMVYSN